MIDATAPSLTKMLASKLHPWKVRYCEPPPEEEGGSAPDPQWEVYLPPGTLTIGSGCYVMNNPASETSGHGDDGDGEDERYWYKFPLSYPGTGKLTYHIVAHGKDNVSMSSGSAGLTAAAPFVMVTSERITTESESAWEPQSDATAKRHYAADVWSAVIATVTIETKTENGETVTSRKVVQALTASVNVPAGAPTYFCPKWELSWDGDNTSYPLTVDRLYLENRTLYVGSVAATDDGETELKEATGAYVEIDTSGDTPKIEVKAGEPEGSSSAAIAQIVIFLLKDGRVTSDLRVNLSNLPYYRGLA